MATVKNASLATVALSIMDIEVHEDEESVVRNVLVA